LLIPFFLIFACSEDDPNLFEPSITTLPITNITSTTATGGGEVTFDGNLEVTARGIIWSTTTAPTIDLTTRTSNGKGEGTFTSSMGDLSPDTKYFVRAYARNSLATTYGEEEVFQTNSPPIVLATVETTSFSDITSTTASSGGNITFDGNADITERGIVWDIESGPTIDLSTKTSEGAGTGAFSSTMSNLSPSTIFFVRAYATNIAGTAYGNELSFQTESPPVALPTIETLNMSAITSYTARCGGNVESDGNTVILERGIVWDTNTEPTIDLATKTLDSLGIGEGEFISHMSGLEPITKYFVRSYAKNILGTAYGSEQSFQTSELLTDIEGNTYSTVTIGTQVWMVENLKVVKFNDGMEIPLVTDDSWADLTTPAYTWHNHDQVGFEASYGSLYNWYSVESNILCPVGWHVPTISEYDILVDYLGGEDVAGGKLKEIGYTHWKNQLSNEIATNESGFTARGGGFLYVYDGVKFDSFNILGAWLSTTEIDGTDDGVRALYLESNDNVARKLHSGKKNGHSVRCVKD